MQSDTREWRAVRPPASGARSKKPPVRQVGEGSPGYWQRVRTSNMTFAPFVLPFLHTFLHTPLGHQDPRRGWHSPALGGALGLVTRTTTSTQAMKARTIEATSNVRLF